MFVLRYALVLVTGLAFLGLTAFGFRLLFVPMRNAPIGIGGAFIYAGVGWVVSLILLTLAVLAFRRVTFWQRLPLTRLHEWLIVMTLIVAPPVARSFMVWREGAQGRYYQRVDAFVALDDAELLERIDDAERNEYDEGVPSGIRRSLYRRLTTDCAAPAGLRGKVLTALVEREQPMKVLERLKENELCSTQPEQRGAHRELILPLIAPRLREVDPWHVQIELDGFADKAWAAALLMANGWKPPQQDE